MPKPAEQLLLENPLFRKLAEEDRHRLAAVTEVSTYRRGEVIFREGDPSDNFVVVAEGRVKVSKATPDGRDIILELFGSHAPVGAVAVYEDRPYPATAAALEPTTCLAIRKGAFFELLEARPSFVRSLLTGLTRRLMKLSNRMADRSGRMEVRFARLFLNLAQDMGRPAEGEIFIPMVLARQELADLTGTTIETAIRLMSRWNKEGPVRTRSDGFTIVDRRALVDLSLG